VDEVDLEILEDTFDSVLRGGMEMEL